MTDVVTIRPFKVLRSTLINVRHWSGENIGSVRIESESLGSFAIGDRMWIGGLEGFPESRLTTGKIRGVRHTLSSSAGIDNGIVLHEVTIDVDQDRE